MDKITIDTTDLDTGLDAISKQLNTIWEEKCDFYSTKFLNDFGGGEMCCFDLSNGKGMIVVEATFFNDLQINLNYEALKSPFKIIFNLGDTFGLTIGKETSELEKDMYAFNKVTSNTTYVVSIKKQTKVKFLVLFIYDSEFLESLLCDINETSEELKKIIGVAQEGDFMTKDVTNIQLIEELNKTILNNMDGVENRLFLEGQFSTILSLLLLDRKNRSEEAYFTTQEAKLIHSVKSILDQEFVDPPTIKDLAKRVASNTNKVQKLFKRAFNTTINKYVLKKKMEMGRGLLLNSDDTIAQISNRVGIENPSYFSKQFKLHYQLLPSDYKYKNRLSFIQVA